MSEMRKHVATAIQLKFGGHISDQAARFAARAAIEALIEPTDWLLRVGADAYAKPSRALIPHEAKRQKILWAWQAMLREALR